MPQSRPETVGLSEKRFLIDTNHWSYLERGHARVVERIAHAPANSRFYMPVIAQGELIAGIEVAGNPARRAALREWYERTIHGVAEVLPITSEVAEQYGRIFGTLRKAGIPISSNDIWIAAIAATHDLILVTSDQDFSRIPGLTIENWTVA